MKTTYTADEIKRVYRIANRGLILFVLFSIGLVIFNFGAGDVPTAMSIASMLLFTSMGFVCGVIMGVFHERLPK